MDHTHLRCSQSLRTINVAQQSRPATSYTFTGTRCERCSRPRRPRSDTDVTTKLRSQSTSRPRSRRQPDSPPPEDGLPPPPPPQYPPPLPPIPPVPPIPPKSQLRKKSVSFHLPESPAASTGALTMTSSLHAQQKQMPATSSHFLRVDTDSMFQIRNIVANVNQPNHAIALAKLKTVVHLCYPVMAKHDLRIDTLSDLIGVHPNLNGCNILQGQTVMIRLRNEADSRFRSVEEIMDTMLHELAHNHFTSHDRQFHKFWDKLRKEYKSVKENTLRGSQTSKIKCFPLLGKKSRHKKLPPKSDFPKRSCKVTATVPNLTRASSMSSARDCKAASLRS